MRKSGVKFGLVGPASKLNKAGGRSKPRPIGAKPIPRRRPPGATAVFDANSDDDEEGGRGDKAGEDPSGVAAVNRRLAAISAKQKEQAKKEYEEALAADPSVFDYDRAYEEMKESRESKAAAATTAREKDKRQPKYIGNLLKQAKLREVESDRIFERKLQKEREEQDKLEGEATMKFVTSAYKKKLMEQKKWELQQQLEEEREQREDVTRTGMTGFYSNLITKNIAMGGDVEKSANSAFTTGSRRHAATDNYEMQDGNDANKQKDRGSRKSDGSGDAVAAREQNGQEGEEDSVDHGPSARMVDPRAAASRKSGAERAEGETDSNTIAAKSAGAARATSRTQNSRRLKEDAEAGTEVSGEAHDRVTATPLDGEGESVGTRRRRDEETAGEGKRADGGTIDSGGRGSKRARQGEEGWESLGVGRVEGEEEGDEAKVEILEADRKTTDELEKAEKEAAAKAKKEAAVKAARERFLARKQGGGGS